MLKSALLDKNQSPEQESSLRDSQRDSQSLSSPPGSGSFDPKEDWAEREREDIFAEIALFVCFTATSYDSSLCLCLFQSPLSLSLLCLSSRWQIFMSDPTEITCLQRRKTTSQKCWCCGDSLCCWRNNITFDAADSLCSSLAFEVLFSLEASWLTLMYIFFLEGFLVILSFCRPTV